MSRVGYQRAQDERARKKAEAKRLHGLIEHMPEDHYHAHKGSLSVSGAKTILRAPALFQWQQDHPVHKDVFDVGSAAHKLVLGVGAEIVEVEADSWRTKAAKEAKDAAHADGKAPILRADYEQAQAIAHEVHGHPEIGRLFATGAAEQSVYATDPDTGIPLRCRPDWLTETNDGRPVCIDVKSTAKGTHERDLLGRYGAIAKFGYHQSADFYSHVLGLAGVRVDALFGLLFVSKSGVPMPRLVWLDGETLYEGRRLNREAIDTYARCTESGDWSCPHPAFITGSIFEREAL